MKKYLIITISILSCYFCKCQKYEDSMSFNKDTTGYIFYSNGSPIWESGAGGTIDIIELPYNDTLKVLLLITDTADGIHFWNTTNYLKGYVVAHHSAKNPIDSFSSIFAKEIYLDDKKKILPESVIVWEVKYIE